MLIAAIVLLAQTASFQEKVTVSYVEVPVTVVGRDGTPVRGLTKDNFELIEGREKRAIESFEAIDLAAAETRQEISPLHPESRRSYLLLFDLSFSTPQAVARAQEAARGFVARSVGRRDLVAVAAVDVDRGFRYLTAFTTDRELLVAAIADPRSFRSRDPLQIGATNYLSELTGGTTTTSTGERQELFAETAADIARNASRLDDAYRRARAKKQMQMLGDVALSMRALSGRKHLVLLSEGFDPRLVTGRGAQASSEQAQENRAVESGELWKVDSDVRYGETSSQRELADMARSFRRADVVLHAVDIQGVRVQNSVREGARVSSNDGLFLLASSTGGTVFHNSNDMSTDFEKLARQHEVVYVLGFHAPVRSAGTFHELRVRLVDVPNARVMHRGGYYSAGGEGTLERSLSLAEVIVNDIAQDDIDVQALAVPFPRDARAQVPVVLEIDGDDLIAKAAGGVATTDIFVYGFDQDGIVRDAIHQRVTLDLSKAGERLKDHGIRFYGTLRLPPGNYALKTLVRIAESDAKGYRRIDVEVGSEGDPTVAPLFMADPQSNWVMVRAADREAMPYPFVVDGESFIPAVKPELRRGEPRLLAVFVQNAEAEEIDWEISPASTLVSQNGGTYVFSVDRVTPETREVTVTMRRRGSTDARTATIPIDVQ